MLEVIKKKRKIVFTGYAQKHKWIKKLASTMYDLRILLEDDHNSILPEEARTKTLTHLEEIYEIVNLYSEKYQDTELDEELGKQSGTTYKKKNKKNYSRQPKWKEHLK
jgi:hypothetical protein